MAASFVGTWSYRSFTNEPDLSVPFNDLRCGMGEMVLTEPAPGKVGGRLEGPGFSLDLDGSTSLRDPSKIRFKRRGEINGETWEYDYQCFVVSNWTDEGEKVDTMVGSIVMKHYGSNGQSPRDCTGSWYAVRQANEAYALPPQTPKAYIAADIR